MATVATQKSIAFFLCAALMIFPFAAAPAAAADITGYAQIQADGSLIVNRRLIRLYGIYIPFTETTCRSFLRPRRCGSRAALALDLRLQGFVHCREQWVNEDGSISAVCHADYTSVSMGEDLAAYLLELGWAVALPGAPFEYHVLERIARHKSLGIWGFSEMIIR